MLSGTCSQEVAPTAISAVTTVLSSAKEHGSISQPEPQVSSPLSGENWGHGSWYIGWLCSKRITMGCDDVTAEPGGMIKSSQRSKTKAPIGSAKTFRSYDQRQMLFMPPSLDD